VLTYLPNLLYNYREAHVKAKVVEILKEARGKMDAGDKRGEIVLLLASAPLAISLGSRQSMLVLRSIICNEAKEDVRHGNRQDSKC
jgi:hypothetical protein